MFNLKAHSLGITIFSRKTKKKERLMDKTKFPIMVALMQEQDSCKSRGAHAGLTGLEMFDC